MPHEHQTQKASGAHTQKLLRMQEAVQLRAKGWTYDRIGQKFGVSKVSAYRWVKEALEEVRAQTAEDAEHLRQLELERLNKIERVSWAAWKRGIGKKTVVSDKTGGKDGVEHKEVTEEINGDPRYLQVLLGVQDRRAKLLGIDAQKDEKDESTGQAPEALAAAIVGLLDAVKKRVEAKPAEGASDGA